MKKTSIRIQFRIPSIVTLAVATLFLLAACNSGNKIEPVTDGAIDSLAALGQKSLTNPGAPIDTAAALAAQAEKLKGTGKPGKASDFRTGRFKYDDETKFGDFIIIRSKDSQLDSGSITQLAVKFDLKWVNDTAYTMHFNSIVENPQNISLPDPKGMYRKCWMTDIREDNYLEISTTSMSKDTLRTRISRLKK